MKTAGIIAEYNPFHLGHKYHIQKTREAGVTHIVCVMSGSVVQRGDIAIYDSHQRAEQAILGGADLVLELPVQFSLTPARDFAKAGVEILWRLGCVDTLSFGAESDDLFKLYEILEKIENGELKIKDTMAKGRTYPQAVAELLGDDKTALSQNNILALEYLRALRGTKIQPLAVKRTVPHDSETPFGCYASASYIREIIKAGCPADKYTGYETDFINSAFIENAERAILYVLSMKSEEDFGMIPYSAELSRRLYASTRRASSLSEIYENVKSRNFTHSRVRRAVMSAALGITQKDMSLPEFVRILALNRAGMELLREIRSRSSIVLSDSLKDLSKLSPGSYHQAEITEVASRLRTFGTLDCKGKSEYRKSVKVITNREENS